MKPFNYLTENVWVWAGTGMVLITLSGRTRTLGLWITVIAVTAHIITSFMGDRNE